VRRLEEGDVPLEESIALYEEGMKLGAKCKKMLDDAEQRVKRLTVEIEKEGA
jgi:exodeoxyribonuclease VII small subunit